MFPDPKSYNKFFLAAFFLDSSLVKFMLVNQSNQGSKSLSLPWAWHSSAPACFCSSLSSLDRVYHSLLFVGNIFRKSRRWRFQSASKYHPLLKKVWPQCELRKSPKNIKTHNWIYKTLLHCWALLQYLWNYYWKLSH